MKLRVTFYAFVLGLGLAVMGCESDPGEDSCDVGELNCGGGVCVASNQVCDGVEDCPGGEDEQDCGCDPATEFACDDGSCVDVGAICDGADDCPAGEDEVGCNCDPVAEFACDDGGCIAVGLACDGNQDCSDGSDEAPLNTACGADPELDCTDGIDNDGDGQTDCDDSDCGEALECHTWPADPASYTYTRPVYVRTLEIPELIDDVPACCKDFGVISRDHIEMGTNEVDNAIAKLADTLAGIPQLGMDLQAELDDAIEQGDLVLLLDHPNLTGDPDDFLLVELFGALEGSTTAADAYDGLGTFLVDPAGFVPGTGQPSWILSPAALNAGEMSAGPSEGRIQIPAPMMMSVPLREAEFHGDATLYAGSVTYFNGTMSGYVTLADIFDAYNDFVGSAECSCLGLTGPLFTVDGDGNWTGNCVDIGSTTCDTSQGSAEMMCAMIAGDGFTDLCGLAPNILGGLADIDLDNDPGNGYEALSFGAYWEGVEADIVGTL